MSQAIIPFAFEGAQVRAVVIDGEPHFVARDVASRLGYANEADALNRHCKGVAKRYPLSTPGGIQQLRVLAEADVLRLIVGSKLPAAQRFERWVFEEVLPTIRRTGGYGPIDVRDPKQLAVIASQLLGVNQELRQQVEALEPKAQALDRLSEVDGSFSLSAAAGLLRVSPQRLRKHLLLLGWVRRSELAAWRLEARPRWADAGVVAMAQARLRGKTGWKADTPQLRITPKGMTALADALRPPQLAPSEDY